MCDYFKYRASCYFDLNYANYRTYSNKVVDTTTRLKRTPRRMQHSNVFRNKAGQIQLNTISNF